MTDLKQKKRRGGERFGIFFRTFVRIFYPDEELIVTSNTFTTMKLLEGKVAVVTGAARGIGKAIALQFAKEGANVAFTDLVIDENGKATEAEIAALGVKAKGLRLERRRFRTDPQGRRGDRQGVRPHRHPGEQRRNHEGRPDDAHVRGPVGRRADGEPQVGVQLHPRRRTRHGAPEERLDHQHVVGRGRQRQRRAVQLLGFEGRYDRSGEVDRQARWAPAASVPTASPRDSSSPT